MKGRDSAHRLSRLGAGARAELSALLSASEEARGEGIGRLHSRAETRDLAEVLIDLEADPVLRLQVLRTLRDLLADPDSP